ncbi:MAG: hypothetical protein ABJE95_30255 [Byssovorax sp.]
MVGTLALLGCGGGGAEGSGGGTSSTASGISASSGGSGSGGSGGAPSVATPGTIQGSAGGKTVDKVAAAYLIGKSDDPAHTTVVYVFDKPIACADIGAPGWDKTVTSATGALEMKLIGVAPGKYAVSTGVTPAQGEASVNFTVTSKTATPIENGSNGGFVQLDTLDAGKLAKGSFDLQFSDGMLKGTFSAEWCPGGTEP